MRYVISSIVISLVSATSPAWAYTGSELAEQAKISIEQARASALKAFPGAIRTEELEREQGGSGLRYTFVVKGASKLQEVGVDAISGAILENAPE